MAATEVTGRWPVEEIPDAGRLFMRVHHQWLDPEGLPAPGAFEDHEGSMSTDWEKYSTPQDTLQRALTLARRGVVLMTAGDVREIPNLRVTHTPAPQNQAHTDVLGEKSAEVRMKLSRICTWAIPIPPLSA